MWWPAVVKSEWEPNQRLQIQLQLLMMSGMPLETCWAFNERWINKFYYKVASCWLFLLSHTTMLGSMNIKFTNFSHFFYFGMKLYMFRTVPLSIIRSFSLYTQQWYMSYTFADSLRAGSGWNPDPARKLSANPYDIYHCCVYSKKLLMMDRGTVRNL